jgi:predicted metal-dependent enzyme (double-stranded beta helix superfamily)
MAPPAAELSPAVEHLVADLERVAALGDPDEQVTAAITAMRAALQDPTILDLYAGRERSFLVWSLPGSFALHASVHAPGHVTAPHDHGPAWAVYGVAKGPTTFRRFRRGQDVAQGVASLIAEPEVVLERGAVEVVPPGHVHGIANETDAWNWNLVVRSRLLKEVRRNLFDLVSGAYRTSEPATPSVP